MESKAPTGRVDHVTLAVANVAQARAFALRVLGFTVTAQAGRDHRCA